MQTLYERRVQPADIDNLGHMNVRVYAHYAAQAGRALAKQAGLDDDALGALGCALLVRDAHTRYYREQLLDAPLTVLGGIAEVTPQGMLAYFELINSDNGARAATFNNLIQMADDKARDPVRLPADIIARAQALVVERPAHGLPRSLPLDPLGPIPTLAEMETHGFPRRFEPYDIEPDDVDDAGFMDLSDGPSLPFAKMPIKFKMQGRRGTTKGDPRIAVATIESRQTMLGVPKLGDRVVTCTAHLDVTEKSVKFQHWSFNEKTGAPFSVLTQLGLGFNLETRKTHPFPPEMREQLENQRHPAFA